MASEKKLKIDCLADLHGYKPELPGGDLLILAGDYTATDKLTEWYDFFEWLKQQKYDHKIVIAGNHDNFFMTGFPKTEQEAFELRDLISYMDIDVDFEYLCDSGTEYKGLKIWGSPWTHYFQNVNPKCTAFMDEEADLEKKFRLIPEGLDILITHGPMYGMLDTNIKDYYCGSHSLLYHMGRTNPKYHIFGHIHECGGIELETKHTRYINCSYVNERYVPMHKAMRLEI